MLITHGDSCVKNTVVNLHKDSLAYMSKEDLFTMSTTIKMNQIAFIVANAMYDYKLNF